MIYSVVVWGFDAENDYQHDCVITFQILNVMR